MHPEAHGLRLARDLGTARTPGRWKQSSRFPLCSCVVQSNPTGPASCLGQSGFEPVPLASGQCLHNPEGGLWPRAACPGSILPPVLTLGDWLYTLGHVPWPRSTPWAVCLVRHRDGPRSLEGLSCSPSPAPRQLAGCTEAMDVTEALCPWLPRCLHSGRETREPYAAMPHDASVAVAHGRHALGSTCQCAHGVPC